jgi:hypothetical protein
MSHPLNDHSAQPPPAAQIPRRKIIPTSPKSHKRASQPTTNGNPDKIDGLTRELYALIGDNAPSLAQVKEELALAGNGRKRWAGKEERGKTGVRWFVSIHLVFDLTMRELILEHHIDSFGQAIDSVPTTQPF